MPVTPGGGIWLCLASRWKRHRSREKYVHLSDLGRYSGSARLPLLRLWTSRFAAILSQDIDWRRDNTFWHGVILIRAK